MAYTIKFPDEVTEEMIAEITQKIDPVCYPDLELDPEHELDIFRANNLTHLALLQDGDLIGHLALLPISDRVYRDIMSGDVSFRAKTALNDVLPYEQGKRYKLLIDSLAILPRRQKLAAAELLLDGAFAFISILALRGIEVEELIFYAPGRDFLPLIKRASFKKARTASDGTIIYSSKTPDRRKKDALAMRKKIDGVIFVLSDYCGRPSRDINGNTSFTKDLGLSQADMAALKPKIEEKLGVAISDDKYAGLACVRDLAYLG